MGFFANDLKPSLEAVVVNVFHEGANDVDVWFARAGLSIFV
jgi:hypothetical protein